MTAEERGQVIWSVNAWVGMAHPSLSPDVAQQVFRMALEDQIGEVSEREVGYVLGMVAR